MNKIHYQIFSSDPSKPWLMLIHGLFGNLDNLTALRRQFTDSYQVLCVDLPDHGKSATTNTFSFENYAHLLTEMVNTLGIHQLSIAGHSLGGKVAMQMALQQAELIRHLVVLDIAPVQYSARHSNVFNGLNNVNLLTLENRKAADSALSEYVNDNSTRQFLLKSLYQQNHAWHWRFNLNLLQQDYHKLSAAIISHNTFDGPVLFLKGELSDYLVPEHRDAVTKLFPNSVSKMVSNTGHWLHAEKPEVCARVILNFLQKSG